MSADVVVKIKKKILSQQNTLSLVYVCMLKRNERGLKMKYLDLNSVICGDLIRMRENKRENQHRKNIMHFMIQKRIYK